MDFVPDFDIAHVGINCQNEEQAKENAARFENDFGLSARSPKSPGGSYFTTTKIEWMTKPGKGTHGHLAVATSDIAGARKYLEDKGYTFDDNSIKRGSDGSITAVYANEEIGGFAFHLVKRK